MSHYNLTVIFPPNTLTLDLVRSVLDQVLQPYDEDNQDAPGAISPKWDWWAVGGRWRGHFKIAAYSDEQIITRPTSPEFEAPYKAEYSDGGRKDTLDLEGMRAEAAQESGEAWDEYQAIVAGTPEPVPWTEFVERVKAAEFEVLGGERHAVLEAIEDRWRAECGLPLGDAYWDADHDTFDPEQHARYQRESDAEIKALLAQLEGIYGIDQARAEYHAQDRVKATKTAPQYRDWFPKSPIEEYGPYTREQYIQRRRLSAVPGYAVLLVEKDSEAGYTTQWIAKGEMGWFGMSDDTQDSTDYYLATVNKLIDALPGDAVLVTVDCHI